MSEGMEKFSNEALDSQISELERILKEKDIPFSKDSLYESSNVVIKYAYVIHLKNTYLKGTGEFYEM